MECAGSNQPTLPSSIHPPSSSLSSAPDKQGSEEGGGVSLRAMDAEAALSILFRWVPGVGCGACLLVKAWESGFRRMFYGSAPSFEGMIWGGGKSTQPTEALRAPYRLRIIRIYPPRNPGRFREPRHRRPFRAVRGARRVSKPPAPGCVLTPIQFLGQFPLRTTKP